jgi:ribosome-associated protein
METFEITDEYIQLNQLIKVLQWSNDGAHSNFLIDEGQVKVNGVKELRRRNKIYPEMIVEFNSQKVKVIASNE